MYNTYKRAPCCKSHATRAILGTLSPWDGPAGLETKDSLPLAFVWSAAQRVYPLLARQSISFVLVSCALPLGHPHVPVVLDPGIRSAMLLSGDRSIAAILDQDHNH